MADAKTNGSTKRVRFTEDALLQGAKRPRKGSEKEAEDEEVEEETGLSEYESAAQDCITFYLVNSQEDIKLAEVGQAANLSFMPEFTHQVFGEDEVIHGYKDLQVKIYLHAATFTAFLDISYESKSSKKQKEPDDVKAILQEAFPAGFVDSRDEFLASLLRQEKVFLEMLQQHGTVYQPWTEFTPPPPKAEEEEEEEGEEEDEADDGEGEGEEGEEGKPSGVAAGKRKESKQAEGEQGGGGSGVYEYQIVGVDLTAESVQKWHNHLQPFVKFFIDNGQPIDNTDERWLLSVILERRTDAKRQGGEGRSERGAGQGDNNELHLHEGVVYLAGFCTMYRFYYHPDSTRLRLSQVLVLPPFQSRGHGIRLLQHVQATADHLQAHDITVEDPSDALQRLREALDTARLMRLPAVEAEVEQALAGVAEEAAAVLPAPLGAATGREGGGKVDDEEERVMEGEPLNKSGDSGANAKRTTGSVNDDVHSAANDEQLGKEEDDGKKESSRVDTVLTVPASVVTAAQKELRMNRREVEKCWEVLIYLRLPESGSAGRRAWRKLLAWRIQRDEFGAGKEGGGAGGRLKTKSRRVPSSFLKRVVEFDEWERDKQMFIMCKVPLGKEAEEELEGQEEVKGAEEEFWQQDLEEVVGISEGNVEDDGDKRSVEELANAISEEGENLTPEEKAQLMRRTLKAFLREREEQIEGIAKTIRTRLQ